MKVAQRNLENEGRGAITAARQPDKASSSTHQWWSTGSGPQLTWKDYENACSQEQHRTYVGLLFSWFEDLILMGGGTEGFTVESTKLLFTVVSTPASHCRSMGSIPGQCMWDVCWTYLCWDKFLLKYNNTNNQLDATITIVKQFQQDATIASILRNGFTVKPLRRIDAIVASCWNCFTIEHDARNHKY